MSVRRGASAAWIKAKRRHEEEFLVSRIYMTSFDVRVPNTPPSRANESASAARIAPVKKP